MKITAVSQLGFVEEKKKQRRWRSVCLPSQGIGQFKMGGLCMGQGKKHFIFRKQKKHRVSCWALSRIKLVL
jgi:hypothetical protein